MGFPAGFFCGSTLTASILCISAQIHHSNRIRQRNAIREQTVIITELASPAGAYYREFMLPRTASTQVPSSPEKSQQIWTLGGKQMGKEDYFKYGWNLRVEKLAQKVLEVKWQDMRDTAAGGYETLSRLVKKG